AGGEKRGGVPGDPAVERQTPRDRYRSLGLVTVRTARTFEFEAAVVGDIDLLVGVVDEERVGGERQAAEVRGHTGLVEVSGGQAGLIRPLHYTARVDAVDAAALVGGELRR